MNNLKTVTSQYFSWLDLQFHVPKVVI